MSQNFSTIDWIKDSQSERNRIKEIRKLTGTAKYTQPIIEALQDHLMIISVGILTALLCYLITKQESFIFGLKYGICVEPFLESKRQCTSFIEFHWIVYIVLGTLYAIISSVIVTFISPLAKGSGIPEVKTILGGFIIKKFLGFHTLIAKFFGLIFSVASGLSLGKEGPLVHLASTVANLCCRFVDKYHKNEVNKRKILSAACACGVAVAFGAPVGGVLFSLEEVSYYFPFDTMYKSFYMAMVSAITLRLLNPYGTGKLVLFQVNVKRTWYLFELPVFGLLGVLGGLYGAFFIKMVSMVSDLEFKAASISKNILAKRICNYRSCYSWPVDCHYFISNNLY
jgi:chloride channel 3/4/5